MEGWEVLVEASSAGWCPPTGGDHLTHFSSYGYGLWGWRLWVCSLDLKFHTSKHSPGELHTSTLHFRDSNYDCSAEHGHFFFIFTIPFKTLKKGLLVSAGMLMCICPGESTRWKVWDCWVQVWSWLYTWGYKRKGRKREDRESSKCG